MDLSKHDYILNLYDFYHNLLTLKQQEYFESYYYMDLSLSEIAQSFNLSRNAIFDQIKKVEEKLLNYEERLKLYQKYIKIKEVVKDDSLNETILDILKE